MTKPLNLKGMKFGRLTVLKRLHQDKRYFYYWSCICTCGRKKEIRGSHLTHGKIKSCGCLQREVVSDVNKTHGMSRNSFYHCWDNMMSRCTNPKSNRWKYYGGRGISVCKRWYKFENFYKDMFSSYKEGLQLDRIDNNKGYSPKNCKFSTREENGRNKRNNVSYRGILIKDWSLFLDVNYHSLCSYMYRKSLKEAIEYYMGKIGINP